MCIRTWGLGLGEAQAECLLGLVCEGQVGAVTVVPEPSVDLLCDRLVLEHEEWHVGTC